ncbi:MAG: hypothetical protein ABIR79_09140 [Candidatus Binatia bacterium]
MESRLIMVVTLGLFLGASGPVAATTIGSPLLDVGNGAVFYCWLSNLGTKTVQIQSAKILDKVGNDLAFADSCSPALAPGLSCSLSAPTARARAVVEVKGTAKNLRALCIMTDPTDTPRAFGEMH